MQIKPTPNNEIHEEPLMDRRDRIPIAVDVVNRGDNFSRCLINEARQRGWRLVDLELSDGMLPAGITLRGALVMALPDTVQVRGLQETGCLVVRLGRFPHPLDGQCPAVLPDVAAQGQMAADHFADRGFEHVGYVGSDPMGDGRTLFESFRERAAAHNMECHLLQFKPGAPGAPITPTYGTALRYPERQVKRQQQMTDWLREVPKPLGLLGYSDAMAAKLCYMCTLAGYQLPADIAVLGIGNYLARCECNMPSISSIDPDETGTVQEACQLLDRLMAGAPAPDGSVMIPPRGVVVRQSTDMLATPDPDVARALRYMWDHLELDLCVDDIARAAGVTRRKLERGFRRELGRSVNVEMRRKRLEKFSLLLLTTDIPINELAPRVGFRSITYLNNAFRRAYGQSPRQYRKQKKG